MQKPAYELRISDWSSDVCSSDLFKVDFGIIGISGIDDDGTLLDFDYREVRAAQAIIKNSRRVFLATDHTKFGRNAMVRLAHVNEIHAVLDRKSTRLNSVTNAHLVCRLLLEKKKHKPHQRINRKT